MNRDELRTRKESGLLYSRSSNNMRLFHPVDVSTGGTWFGANDRGVVLCLLNRYQAPQLSKAQSRGNIIPEALEQGDLARVDEWLEKLECSQYNPFDLFLISKKKVRHFSWDSESYVRKEQEVKHWFLFSSSSMLTEEVTAFRKNFFQAWNSEMGKKLTDADEILRGFHLIQIPGMETHSVLMEREKSHTKSIIQADLEGKELTIKYIPNILTKSLDVPLADAQMEKMEIRKN